MAQCKNVADPAARTKHIALNDGRVFLFVHKCKVEYDLINETILLGMIELVTIILLCIGIILYTVKLIQFHRFFYGSERADFCLRQYKKGNITAFQRNWWKYKVYAFIGTTALCLIYYILPDKSDFNLIFIGVASILVILELISIPERIKDYRSWYQALTFADKKTYREHVGRYTSMLLATIILFSFIILSFRWLP